MLDGQFQKVLLRDASSKGHGNRLTSVFAMPQKKGVSVIKKRSTLLNNNLNQLNTIVVSQEKDK